jgi:magnesium chelatase family protein
LLLIGPPGTGKSMLAARFPGILAPLGEDEALESAAIHSASSALREPLETGVISLARGARQARFPARFQLVAAMNPCPCGYLGHPSGRCRCTPDAIARYRARISGPFADRIDIKIEAPTPREAQLLAAAEGEPSAVVRERVAVARARQLDRQGKPNAFLGTQEIDAHCAIEPEAEALVREAIARLALSARAYHRVLRVARSIADLAGAPRVGAAQLAEAIQYRKLDAAL